MKRFLTLTLALCMLLALAGCSITTGSKSVKLYQGSLDSEFHTLTLDVDVADIVIEPGDAFLVKYALCHEPVVEEQDGALTIREKADDHWWDGLQFNSDNHPFVMITVPAGTELNGLDVEVDVGDIKVLDLTAGALELDSDVGDLTVQNVKALFTAALSSDVGNIDCTAVTVGGSVSLSTDTGDIRAEIGAPMVQADSDVGNVTLALPGTAADWSMTLETDTGDVTVDGHDQGNRCETSGTQYVLGAKTDGGDVEVTFAE